MRSFCWAVVALGMSAGLAMAADAPSCDSARQCDAMGGKAYRAKDYARAAALYEQQVGWVEQALRDCEAALEDTQSAKAPTWEPMPTTMPHWRGCALASR